MADKPQPSYAPAYAALYPMPVQVARDRGYALCIHGSLTRDFDLVAVPWILGADTPEKLILALTTATGGTANPTHLEPNPSHRPHGSPPIPELAPQACCLDFGGVPCGQPAVTQLVVEWDDGTAADYAYCETHWRGMARVYAREGILVEALPLEAAHGDGV